MIAGARRDISKAMERLSEGGQTEARGEQVRTIEQRLLEFEEDDESFIGSGAYSNVYRGRYKGDPVAVKIVYAPRGATRRILNELLVHQMLDSPSIIRFYGASLVGTRFLIIAELAVGSLYDFLYNKATPPILEKSLGTKVRILSDLAHGVAFLHSVQVIHRDLKPAKWLIGRDGR
jgi:serine/threonine protein kinase